MIAFHFPPLAGSSGIQRTLRFVQHLPEFGWQPAVLSAHSCAYERTSQDLIGDIPEGIVIHRAFALDAARQLQIGGRYLGWMARPDRWISWRFDGVRRGLEMIRSFKPEVIWSTYPIATAHVIAATLHRKTGIPWVADFRDPMAQEGYPADPQTWQSYLAVEQEVIGNASLCVFTTPGAARIYQERYADAADRIVVLENGYDEESFAGASVKPCVRQGQADETAERPLVLLHSGIVYPSERDPTQFFMALGRLQRSGTLMPEALRVRFRAAVHEDMLRELANRYGAEDFIEICPAIPYREALAEMLAVDALLVMQAPNCNAQIPAKIYEYLRAGRPILALTDPNGDTASALRDAGLSDIVSIDSAADIEVALPAVVATWLHGSSCTATPDAVRGASRRVRAESLAGLLQRAIYDR